MSINVRDLIKRDFFTWLKARSDGIVESDGSTFWVHPVSEDDPEYKSRCDEELSLIKSIKEFHEFQNEHINGARLKIEQKIYVCLHHFEGAEKLGEASPNFAREESVPFLLRILAATKLRLPATKPVPARLISEAAKDGGFAADFQPYLPRLHFISVSEDHSRLTKEQLFASIYCAAVTTSQGEWLEDVAAEFVMSIPEKDHDWILGESMDVFASKNYVSMFLAAYRVAEFFYPLTGVNKLKSKIKSDAPLVSVLQSCREALGWHWQHGKSAKAAASMAASGKFLLPLKKAQLIPENCSSEDGAEKLALIRNELAHQGFKRIARSEPELKAAISATLLFCSEAFETYKAWDSRRERSMPDEADAGASSETSLEESNSALGSVLASVDV